MTGRWLNWRKYSLIIGITLGITAVAIWWQFRAELIAAQARVAQSSTLVETPCGPIEYQQAGSGVPLLAVHGSGGGYDQGMAFAAPLTSRGIRVIAMSRFWVSAHTDASQRHGRITGRCVRLPVGRARYPYSSRHGRVGWGAFSFADGDPAPGQGICADPAGALGLQTTG